MNNIAREVGWLLKEKYGGEKTEGFFTDQKRLESGEPLAYIIGHVPFLDTTIYLDSHPLIPRPETEYWVGKALKTLPLVPLRILDLCAGSGCIGIALLKALPDAHVDLFELMSEHHETIRKNLKENGIDQKRARIYGGDLFAEVTGTYDHIFSNPPYVARAKAARVEASVMRHEPHEALFAGEDGLALISRIIAEAPEYLKSGGSLFIEHEPEQAPSIRELAQKRGYRTVETKKDQYGIIRVTQLQR